jgi:hypothetical protein
MVAATVAACALTAWAQSGGARIGYVYPAGGQQGAGLRVTVGGQSLRDVVGVHITGTGVAAAVADYVRPLSNQELGQTARFLRDMVKLRWSVQALGAATRPPDEEPPLPDHPWLHDLHEQTPAELARLRTRLFDAKKQPNAQIAEQVEVEVSIAPDAPPGDRELRLVTATGLTNPVRFQVGSMPEVREDAAGQGDVATSPVSLPVILNGQIAPGDADRFALQCRAGQQLVILVQARRLIPYLADAVPGWFQATVALYDADGNEVAYEDDYRFDPDPVLSYRVPRDGVYSLEIRDALYRGREDFVYRIVAGELPFVTSVFPPGGQPGIPTTAAVTGWNLPATELTLDTAVAGETIRPVTAIGGAHVYGNVAYAVDDLPQQSEAEPNDTPQRAQAVALPQVVNGRIGHPGDVDIWRLTGKAGQEVVAEVCARRLGSPLDSALRLLDAVGASVAANDDHDDPEAGLLTHQADAYLRAKLPADGDYLLQVMDAQGKGGPEYVYRLRVSEPRPDFALRAVPSSLGTPRRRPAIFTVRALRRDGFDGEIAVAAPELPPGFSLSAGKIPGDKDSVQLTLTPPNDLSGGVFGVRLEGRAQIGGATVTRPVVPAEDMMQAFAYRHLVPQQELLVAITGTRPLPAVWKPLVAGVQMAEAAPIRIPLGGTTQVQVTAAQTVGERPRVPLSSVAFSLTAPPRGVRLQASETTPGGVLLTFKADANSAEPGRTGYLIVEAIVGPGTQRTSLGVLPAIPFEIVRTVRAG